METLMNIFPRIFRFVLGYCFFVSLAIFVNAVIQRAHADTPATQAAPSADIRSQFHWSPLSQSKDGSMVAFYTMDNGSRFWTEPNHGTPIVQLWMMVVVTKTHQAFLGQVQLSCLTGEARTTLDMALDANGQPLSIHVGRSPVFKYVDGTPFGLLAKHFCPPVI
jgi:hypothetical protein